MGCMLANANTASSDPSCMVRTVESTSFSIETFPLHIDKDLNRVFFSIVPKSTIKAQSGLIQPQTRTCSRRYKVLRLIVPVSRSKRKQNGKLLYMAMASAIAPWAAAAMEASEAFGR